MSSKLYCPVCKNMILNLPIIETDVRTLNGNYYSKEAIEKIVWIFENSGKKFYGEVVPLNSSERGKYMTTSEIGNVTHHVKEINLDGDTLYAKVELMKGIPNIDLFRSIKNGDLILRPTISGIIKRNEKNLKNEIEVRDLISFDFLEIDEEWEVEAEWFIIK